MYLKEAMLIASFFICVQAVVQVASVVVSLTLSAEAILSKAPPE